MSIRVFGLRWLKSNIFNFLLFSCFPAGDLEAEISWNRQKNLSAEQFLLSRQVVPSSSEVSRRKCRTSWVLVRVSGATAASKMVISSGLFRDILGRVRSRMKGSISATADTSCPPFYRRGFRARRECRVFGPITATLISDVVQ